MSGLRSTICVIFASSGQTLMRIDGGMPFLVRRMRSY